MPGDDLFAREEEVVARAEAALAAAGAGAARPLEELLAEYGRLLRTTRRIMRLSDRNERELNRMAERQRQASEALSQKNQELEALSGKLAKYLSPQVYGSIFSGRQEVKLASRRKKLTVFFSDIAGFTELTDRMESEDLTKLLNQYLTEMSRVALQHGATIDKYIGDAIMIFFGDPDTRGVREDALACVKMAIAMQGRLRELAGSWHDQGLESALTCRIGINTGYCTVGNFGSEDRMDYTIVGGAVNIASRLEHEAEPGAILITRETYAQIRDAVACKELGPVKVKGVAYPVTVYEVDCLRQGEDGPDPLAVDLPHVKLSIDCARLSDAERGEALRLLDRALTALRRGAGADEEDGAEGLGAIRDD